MTGKKKADVVGQILLTLLEEVFDRKGTGELLAIL